MRFILNTYVIILVIVQSGWTQNPPVVQCPEELILHITDPSVCEILFIPDITVSDESDTVQIYINGYEFDPAGVWMVPGVYQMEAIAFDTLGQSDRCTFQVVVIDSVPPVIITPPPLVLYVIDPVWCSAGATISFSGIHYEDNCFGLILGYQITANTHNCLHLYAHPGCTISVDYSINEYFGYGVRDTVSVVVPLEIFPVSILDCPSDTILYQSEACPRRLYWKVPVVAGICNIVDRQNSHSTGEFLEIGDHILTYRYVDRDSAVYECQFMISVLQLPDTLYEHRFVCPELGLSANDTIIYAPATYCFDTCDYVLCIDIEKTLNSDTLIKYICSDQPYVFWDSVLIVPGSYVFIGNSWSICYYVIIHYNTEHCVTSATHIEQARMSVYPNPSSGLMHIEIPWLQSVADYDIWSVDGTCIQAGNITATLSEIRIETSGLYMLRVRTDDIVMVQKIFVR